MFPTARSTHATRRAERPSLFRADNASRRRATAPRDRARWRRRRRRRRRRRASRDATRDARGRAARRRRRADARRARDDGDAERGRLGRGRGAATSDDARARTTTTTRSDATTGASGKVEANPPMARGKAPMTTVVKTTTRTPPKPLRGGARRVRNADARGRAARWERRA